MTSTLQPNTPQLSPKQQVHADRLEATLNEAIERLAEQLSAGHSEDYLNLLSFYSQFWRYSPRNLLLIRCQRPDATQIAGYTTWKRLGRQVKLGAKAIWVWAPILKKETVDGVEQEVCVGFRPAPVHPAEDLVDIETNPLPTLVKALPNDVSLLYERCVRRVESLGVVVQEQILKGGIQGVSRGPELILIHRKLDSRNRLFVLIHEFVHNRWHQANREREHLSNGQMEFESESVSYVVAAIFGLEHPTARDYLIHWGATKDTLQQSLTVIQRLTREVCRVLEVATEQSPADPRESPNEPPI